MEKRIPVKTYEQADVSSQKEYERKMGMDEFSYEEVPIGKQGYATSDKAVDKVKGQPVVDQSQHGGPEYPLQWEFEEGGEWVDEWIKDNPNHPAYQEFLESQRKKGDDAVFGAIEGGEGKDIFEDIAGIKKGMSEFEKNIAMSENAPLFESGDISSSTYTDRYMDTGEDRPAWGFGSKDTGQIDRSFTASIEDMRANISNTESQLQKSIGKDEWESLPQSVRESVIEMGYIMGVSKLNKEFKKMMKALKEGDIRRAGMEATWRDVISGTKAGWISHVKEQRSDRILSGFRIPKKR